MVARHVVEHRVVRNLKDIILQLFQRRHTRHLFLRLWITEDKIAKAHVLRHQMVEVDIHLRRVLIDKMEALSLSLSTIDGLRRIEDQWHILIATTNLLQQSETCLWIALLHMTETTLVYLYRETGITNHAQRVLVILLVELHRLLIGCGQHHLRTSTLTLGSSMGVQGLSRESLTLGKDVIVDIRQHGGVETDVILHEEYHLHTSFLDIVVNVHLVLNQLDDRHDEVSITQPTEHVVEHRHILILDALGDTMRERCQHHARDVGVFGLDLTGHGKGVVVSITRHTNHEIDVCGMEHLVSLLRRRYLGKGWRVTHTQFHIFIKDLLIHAPVVLQHKGIVRVGHDEHIEDAACHQVDKRHIF